MATRDELANALLDCLSEVSSLLDHAYEVAMGEQQALVKSDAEALTLSCKAQDEILRRIAEADQRAAAVATQIAQSAGLDPDTADAGTVAAATERHYEQLIRQMMNRVSIAAARVKQANEINARLLANGLDIITSCLRTIAVDNKPPAYDRDANLPEQQAYVLSLDRKV